MNAKTVIFDLGNVLIEWDRALLYRQLIDDSDELAWFLDNVFTLEANAILDSGTPLPEVAERIAAAHPDHAELVMVIADRWKETLGEVIDGSVAILESLASQGTPLYALSNWGKDTFAMIENDYAFFSHFDGMVISGREGVTKPNPAIFELLCARYSLAPDQCVFIDDSSANVAAAADLGFDAILFTDADALHADLVDRELLDPSPTSPPSTASS